MRARHTNCTPSPFALDLGNLRLPAGRAPLLAGGALLRVGEALLHAGGERLGDELHFLLARLHLLVLDPLEASALDQGTRGGLLLRKAECLAEFLHLVRWDRSLLVVQDFLLAS